MCEGGTLAKTACILIQSMLVVALLDFNKGKLYLLLFVSLPVGSEPSILTLTPIQPQR